MRFRTISGHVIAVSAQHRVGRKMWTNPLQVSFVQFSIVFFVVVVICSLLLRLLLNCIDVVVVNGHDDSSTTNSTTHATRPSDYNAKRLS